MDNETPIDWCFMPKADHKRGRLRLKEMSEANFLRIDSHKLIYHIPRVNHWLKKREICPIYIEIGTSGACNHRCIFCGLDYLKYKPRFIDKDILKKRLSEMSKYGVKSIMYAGEGEPLLHKDIADIILHTKKAGIDVAVTTNGVLFDKGLAQKCLRALTWIRFSIDAGRGPTYARIHNCKPADFDHVLKNIRNAVRMRKRYGYAVTIGAQLLLLPENYNEAVRLASLLREIGADYLIIKPFSQHPLSRHRLSRDFSYSDYFYLNEKLQKFATSKFKVIFRIKAMKKFKEGRSYRHCLGLPFWAYIDSTGNVWACSSYLGDSGFLYGNINKKSFGEILKGEVRKRILKMAATELDIRKCREACRLDEINRYLWELKHPSSHVNFI